MNRGLQLVNDGKSNEEGIATDSLFAMTVATLPVESDAPMKRGLLHDVYINIVLHDVDD